MTPEPQTIQIGPGAVFINGTIKLNIHDLLSFAIGALQKMEKTRTVAITITDLEKVLAWHEWKNQGDITGTDDAHDREQERVIALIEKAFKDSWVVQDLIDAIRSDTAGNIDASGDAHDRESKLGELDAGELLDELIAELKASDARDQRTARVVERLRGKP